MKKINNFFKEYRDIMPFLALLVSIFGLFYTKYSVQSVNNIKTQLNDHSHSITGNQVYGNTCVNTTAGCITFTTSTSSLKNLE